MKYAMMILFVFCTGCASAGIALLHEGLDMAQCKKAVLSEPKDRSWCDPKIPEKSESVQSPARESA